MSRGLKFFIIITALFVFWIVVAPKLATGLIVERKLQKADAIIMLSGSAVYKERARRTAQAYRQSVSEFVVISDDGGEAGWSNIEERNPKFVELARKALVEQGVAPDSIVELAKSVSGTNDEAAAFKSEAAKRGWKSVLVVTSAYHSRRALWTFENEFKDVDMNVGIVSPPPGERTPPPFTWWLSPRGWRLVGGEYLKTAYYWVFY